MQPRKLGTVLLAVANSAGCFESLLSLLHGASPPSQGLPGLCQSPELPLPSPISGCFHNSNIEVHMAGNERNPDQGHFGGEASRSIGFSTQAEGKVEPGIDHTGFPLIDTCTFNIYALNDMVLWDLILSDGRFLSGRGKDNWADDASWEDAFLDAGVRLESWPDLEFPNN